jgi:hypothetical protein
MPEWWTYTLSDFLLFSPRTYYRLIERHNLALWPAHLLTLGAGALVAVLLRRSTPERSRTVAAAVAAVWAWVGWSFLARRYATINWAAVYAAWLFAGEAILLGWLGAVSRALRFGWSMTARGIVGAALFGAAVFLYPLLALVLRRGWIGSEVFGIVPDPTAIATLGLLLAAEGSPRSRLTLLLTPLAWCLLSGATLWAMGAPEAWVLLSSAVLAVALSIRGPRAP